ncbi:unnamed protein product, partial [Cyprideis torosa]
SSPTLRDLRGLDKDPAEAVAGGLGRDLRGLDKDPAEAGGGWARSKGKRRKSLRPFPFQAPSLTNLGSRFIPEHVYRYESSSVKFEDRKSSAKNSELSPVTKQRIEKLRKGKH